MKEYIEFITNPHSKTKTFVITRVIQTWGSSPRPVGSLMFVNQDGQMIGSVSGGCVENSVVKHAQKIFEKGEQQSIQFGVSDEDAWSVGLSCGGSVKVFQQKADFDSDPVWSILLNHQINNQSAVLISSLTDTHKFNALWSETEQTFGDPLPSDLLDEINHAYAERSHRIIKHQDIEYFIQIFPRKPQLFLIGAAHITVDLITLGKLFGFETIVIDPRGYFTENTVFKDQPDQLFNAYPSEVLHQFHLDAYSFAAILSHDPKIDDDALQIMLKKDMGYIGALGSKKTHAKRIQRLFDKGLSQEEINLIQAPIGLPIHAQSAREIALAIIAQVIAFKNQYSHAKK